MPYCHRISTTVPRASRKAAQTDPDTHIWLPLEQSAGTVSDSILVIPSDGKTLYTGGPRGGVWTYHLDRRRAASH